MTVNSFLNSGKEYSVKKRLIKFLMQWSELSPADFEIEKVSAGQIFLKRPMPAQTLNKLKQIELMINCLGKWKTYRLSPNNVQETVQSLGFEVLEDSMESLSKDLQLAKSISN